MVGGGGRGGGGDTIVSLLLNMPATCKMHVMDGPGETIFTCGRAHLLSHSHNILTPNNQSLYLLGLLRQFSLS